MACSMASMATGVVGEEEGCGGGHPGLAGVEAEVDEVVVVDTDEAGVELATRKNVRVGAKVKNLKRFVKIPAAGPLKADVSRPRRAGDTRPFLSN